MTTGLVHALHVTVCKDVSDATRQGFFYRPPIYLPIAVKQVVVVQKGMKSGDATVDFVLEDEKGQKYVFMLSAKLLRAIPTGDVT